VLYYSNRVSLEGGIAAMSKFFRVIAGAALSLALVGTASAQGAAAQGGAPPVAPRCVDCGVVQTIRYYEQKGEGSGAGLIAGGVVGGVLGHQIGSGRGNTAATILGAGAGAYAGNQVEKNVKKKSYWSVAIRMDDGNTRSFTYSARPTVHEGERVKLVEGGKRLALLAN
jgi:outer membrane lipoprotein SlyB